MVVSSGERFDFWIEASDPEALGAYWVRAETLERTQNGQVRNCNVLYCCWKLFSGKETNRTKFSNNHNR